VSEDGPPQRPPQISPDGKWVWDGSEWQPVAGRDSGHTAVFPAFNPAALQASMVDPAPVAPVAGPFAAPPPVVNYAVNYSSAQTSVPLWQQVKPGQWSKYLYVAAGVVVLVMAGIFLSSLGPVTLPWVGSPQAGTPSPAPSLLSQRSDYAAADQYVAGSLVPAVVDMNKTVAKQALSCNLVLTIGCQDALTATDGQVKNVLATVNGPPAPVCIAANVGKVKVDLSGLEIYLKNAFQAYSDGSKGELAAALAGFYYTDHALQLDIIGMSKAQSTLCDTQLVGP
jgi:hypothetical protein